MFIAKNPDVTSWHELCIEFHAVTNNPKCIQTLCNAPKHEFWGPMEWTRCIRCEKSRCDFVARACALIAPVHTILHRVSCTFETLRNPTKHYETHQYMSLGSNGVDWVCSLRKISMRFRATNFCIYCTSSTRFAPSFMQ